MEKTIQPQDGVDNTSIAELLKGVDQKLLLELLDSMIREQIPDLESQTGEV